MDDNPEDYRSLTYEYWCDLLSTIEVQGESKRAAAHINNIASAMAASRNDALESSFKELKREFRGIIGIVSDYSIIWS